MQYNGGRFGHENAVSAIGVSAAFPICWALNVLFNTAVYAFDYRTIKQQPGLLKM